ncbi:Pyrimidine synthesis [Balamuthia mandrillaris]
MATDGVSSSSSVAAELQQRKRAKLVLQDGSVYQGFSFGAERSIGGECVFQTGMVGYVESLTDPSYRGQILVLSFPLIGNYGVPPEDSVDEYGIPRFIESERIQVAGLIVADYSEHHSHWNARTSLSEWLRAHNVPAITGIDTRSIIKKIRDGGVTLAKMVNEDSFDKEDTVVPLEDPNRRNLVAEVSRKTPQVYGSGKLTVMAVDCGMKYNQLRCFLKRGVTVKVVPWDHDLLAEDRSSYDGVFLSNGPGDPTMCSVLVENVRKLLEREAAQDKPKPIFGICLGNQILGLAAGGRTYKLKFGNRGHNQPCVDTRTNRCHLTMQNHGFALDSNSLPPEWKQLFYNANDQTNEGIYHVTKPFYSVQFHPEARGGPNDTEYLFDLFIAQMEFAPEKIDRLIMNNPGPAFVSPQVTKVLILGSGGLSIGQAGEFDYSGSQAIKALKEEKIKTVLLNPNIATVQTSSGLADKVYFLPVTPEYVIKVLEWEKPDGILLTFGGQTALNCGIELYNQGIFEKMGVTVLGTPLSAIIATEDREIFAQELKKIDESIAPSFAARSLSAALKAAEDIGYPVVVRAGFALGGLGSGFANNKEEFKKLATMAFAQSEQILIEKSLKGWKEIEYEVVRDAYDNCITVCNMENFDPLGVHTGESIVVAPSQTLSDKEYHMLRMVSTKVVRHLGIVGECNIQFALNPLSEEYFIIEVNARLSRSSALASKATGYPLAFVAAKLALGVELPKLRNSVTKVTTACWEPSLDYIVVKMPRWDLQKFQRVDGEIGTSMKSVGEVMAIGRTFEEAIQKAMRMVNGSSEGFASGMAQASNEGLRVPSINRMKVIAQAMKEGVTVNEIHQLSSIDRWFLHKLKAISDFEQILVSFSKERGKDSVLPHEIMLQAKKYGFSDKQIAKLVGSTELVIRKMRKEMNILPVVKQIDTVAAEFPAQNNYLYLTYNATENDIPVETFAPSDPLTGDKQHKEGATIVLGSGAYCIGSSVEFDYCAVRCIKTLQQLGKQTIMINYNPETVSTDYDECDKLYFEELSLERVTDIYEREKVQGVVVSMGGQLPNNIAMALSRLNINVLGTSPEMIDNAENRFKFSRMLDQEGVDQPRWKDCSNLEETKLFCEEVGYPCLVRPSFVLSGAGMSVVNTPSELENFLQKATVVNGEHRVVISKFIENAKELDVDAVAQNGEVIVFALSEHVENAGVHSGDATLVLPAQDVSEETAREVEKATRCIAKQLNVSGPFNIQFIAKDDKIKVIECNLRASRSFPFVSKVLGIDFIELATKAIVNIPLLKGRHKSEYYAANRNFNNRYIGNTSQSSGRSAELEMNDGVIGVKVPQFSFTRLKGADPVLGVEMASTGEVACFGTNRHEAYLKALVATGFRVPKKHADQNVLLSIGPYSEKVEFLAYAQKLRSMGFNLFATSGTAEFLIENGLAETQTLDWPMAEEDGTATNNDKQKQTQEEAQEPGAQSVAKFLSNHLINLCIILPSKNRSRRPASFMSRGYYARRMAVDYSVPLITNIKAAKLFVDSLLHVPQDNPLHSVDSRSSSRTVILPGLIDVHVHLREPGDEHKEDWSTGTAAALAGGYTMVCAMPNTKPSIVDEETFELMSSLATRKARCDYGLYFGASSNNSQVIASLAHKAVALKMYLNQTYSTLQMDNMSMWMSHFRDWPTNIPIVVHAEGRNMAAALMVASLYDRALHVAHLSLAEEILLIRAAKERGLKVTCEVTPHHLFLWKEQFETIAEGRQEVRPRLATKHDVDTLWENIDIIDCIATDHAPHLVSEKDSSTPPPGFPGLETALPLMLTAVSEGRLTLDQLIEKMYTNPKRIFNLPDQLDTFIEVDLDEVWTIPAHMKESKCKWTPFEGMRVKGKVTRVVLRGKIAMIDGKVLAPPGFGQDIAITRTLLPPSPSQPLKPAGEGPSAVVAPQATPSTVVAAAATPTTVTTIPQSPPPLRSKTATVEPSGDLPTKKAFFADLIAKDKRQGAYPEERTGPTITTVKVKEDKASQAHPVQSRILSHVENLKIEFNARHIVSVKQFSRDDLRYLFSVAHDMRMMVQRMGTLDVLKGKILANTFYEPSTRTQASFAAAMLRLGGTVINVNERDSSVVKGESLVDTIRTLESYADLIVLRHPMAGSAQTAAAVASVPIINAGDGVGEHPSQALLDVFTIREEFGTVNGLRITIVGDLKNGRTVHSLVHLLSLYNIVELNYVSPESLAMPRHILREMEEKGIKQNEHTTLEAVLPTTDVLYVTRMQKERFESEEEYAKVKGYYVINPETLTHARENMIIMHPLPRVDEISPELDSDPRAAYFRQTENGMYIRMALLAAVLGKV